MALKRREKSSEVSSKSSSPPEECSFLKSYPTVAEFLWRSSWEDGASRVTGTITLMAENGQIKAAVHDRDAGCSAFVSAKTFTSLWKVLEKALTEDDLEWRAKDPQGGSQRGKRS